MNEAVAWESVLHRDPSADDRFLYGVTTTGIYCRPSCPSRRPKRGNVAFFSSVEAAPASGARRIAAVDLGIRRWIGRANTSTSTFTISTTSA